jgi:hypothetical protein
VFLRCDRGEYRDGVDVREAEEEGHYHHEQPSLVGAHLPHFFDDLFHYVRLVCRFGHVQLFRFLIINVVFKNALQ